MNIVFIKSVRWISYASLCLGIALYLFFIYIWHIEWLQNQSIHRTWMSELWFILGYAVFASGFSPLILGIYFWVFKKNAKDWLAGFIFVPAMIVIHYVVTVFMAHSKLHIYLPMIIAELLCALAIILYWQRFQKR